MDQLQGLSQARVCFLSLSRCQQIVVRPQQCCRRMTRIVTTLHCQISQEHTLASVFPHVFLTLTRYIIARARGRRASMQRVTGDTLFVDLVALSNRYSLCRTACSVRRRNLSAMMPITWRAKKGVSCTKKRKRFSLMGASTQSVLAVAVALRGL